MCVFLAPILTQSVELNKSGIDWYLLTLSTIFVSTSPPTRTFAIKGPTDYNLEQIGKF